MASGRFITFEGGEGAGKSTQARRLAARLGRAGLRVLETREPGGPPLAERMRALLLSGALKELGPETETLLFYAARREHVERMIRPALAEGRWVVCDRFADSTRAYQGGAEGVPCALIDALDRIVVARARPDLTLILDLEPELGLRRASARKPGADRFETEDLAYHARLRQAFLAIAEREPRRCVVIDAAPGPDAVAEAVWMAVKGAIGEPAIPHILPTRPRPAPGA